MNDANPDNSSPTRSRRVVSLALWLLLILAMGISIAWFSTRARPHGPTAQDDYANLFRIEAIVRDDSIAILIKGRGSNIDPKRWCQATAYLLSGNNRREIGPFGGQLGSGSIRAAFSDQPRDKTIQIVVDYRVFQGDATGPLLYQGRKMSGIIDLPAIAREQPGWMKEDENSKDGER